jgi:hypothetical protein
MTLRTMSVTILALSVHLAPSPGQAQKRELSLEHNGSLSLFAATGVEWSAVTITSCNPASPPCPNNLNYFNSVVDLGGTIAVGQSGSELVLRGRFVWATPSWGGSLLLGYRKYFGKDELKTFVGFDLMGTFRPVTTGGARVGFGAIWDFSPVMGLWAEAGGSFGLGVGRRFAAELTIGFQARSYLLE